MPKTKYRKWIESIANARNGNLVEVETPFNILAKHNNNHTWKSSPNEVISEVANYIDFHTKDNAGKLFHELNDSDKKFVAKKIAKRFNLTEDEALTMLNSASPRYLKYGGKINFKNNK